MKPPSTPFPQVVAAIGGFTLVAFGVWAMAAPSGFFDAVALFEPYNAHFLQDIGAFQIGLGATLLFAVFVTADALAAGLLGVGFGSFLHVLSHVMSVDAGGNPAVDIPTFSVLGGLLVAAGAVRLRRVRASAGDGRD